MKKILPIETVNESCLQKSVRIFPLGWTRKEKSSVGYEDHHNRIDVTEHEKKIIMYFCILCAVNYKIIKKINWFLYGIFVYIF
jgi:hypothetical protein